MKVVINTGTTKTFREIESGQLFEFFDKEIDGYFIKGDCIKAINLKTGVAREPLSEALVKELEGKVVIEGE